MRIFFKESASEEPGFYLEMVLLGEFSLLLIYFLYHICYLTCTKGHSTRSKILLFSLIFSTIVRIILFLPEEVKYTKTIMVIDMFTASVCYFTAVSALISQ